jgi:hypothetical protein
MHQKLARSKVAETLERAPGLIRELVAENQGLKEKLAGFEHEGRVRQLAESMHSKGLFSKNEMEEKIAEMRQFAPDRLALREEAVKISAPQRSPVDLEEQDLSAESGGGSPAADRFMEAIIRGGNGEL